MGELTAVASVKRGVLGDLSDLEESPESVLVTCTCGAFLSSPDMLVMCERDDERRGLLVDCRLAVQRPRVYSEALLRSHRHCLGVYEDNDGEGKERLLR